MKRDTGDVAVIQYRDGTVLTEESEVRERWKEYFSQLLNTENEREELESIEKTEGPEKCISSEEVEKALKQMSKAKAAGPTGVVSEMFRALGREGIQWLTKLLNRLLEEETIPEDWRKSTTIPIYKAKENVLDCGNYRGIKLLEHGLKVYERIVDKRLRQQVNIDEMQFGYNYAWKGTDLYSEAETREDAGRE